MTENLLKFLTEEIYFKRQTTQQEKSLLLHSNSNSQLKTYVSTAQLLNKRNDYYYNQLKFLIEELYFKPPTAQQEKWLLLQSNSNS